MYVLKNIFSFFDQNSEIWSHISSKLKSAEKYKLASGMWHGAHFKYGGMASKKEARKVYDSRAGSRGPTAFLGVLLR